MRPRSTSADGRRSSGAGRARVYGSAIFLLLFVVAGSKKKNVALESHAVFSAFSSRGDQTRGGREDEGRRDEGQGEPRGRATDSARPQGETNNGKCQRSIVVALGMPPI